MRTTNPFLISVGIHVGLFALSIGALSILHKSIPSVPDKIKLKIMVDSPEPPSAIIIPPSPIQPPQPITKKPEPAPVPKALQPIAPPIQRVVPQNTPIVTLTHPTAPMTVPVVTKAPEAVPIVAAPKAPPPKVQENYEEENLGRIRSILAERLKYPKNALRLKQQGEAIVTFTLGSDRSVSQVTITKSSEFELLDDAARDLIESSASEFPKPSKNVRISVPIAYKLR